MIRKKEIVGELFTDQEKEKNEFVFSEKKTINDKKLYNKVAKIQNRNSILFSIGIFFYFIAVAFAEIPEEFNEDLGTLGFILGILAATFLVVFSKIERPKEGKIKYECKSTWMWIITIILWTIACFMLVMDNPTSLIEDMWYAIVAIVMGAATATTVYYHKSCGNPKFQIKKEIKISITIIMIILGLVLGVFIGMEDENPIEGLTKSTEVIYAEDSRPIFIAMGKKTWYFMTNEKGSKEFYFSVGKKSDELSTLYVTKDKQILSLEGNDDYAVWTERSKEKISYLYYDKSENEVYEITSFDLKKEGSQNPIIMLYKDRIYFQYTNYSDSTVNVMECNITSGNIKELYSFKVDKKTILLQQFRVEDNNLLITTFNKKPQIIRRNLDTNKEEKINLSASFVSINSISYDNNQYALYYYRAGKRRIGIFDKSGKLQKEVYMFDKDQYLLYNKLQYRKGILYWNNQKYIKDPKKNKTDNYSLLIYDTKTDNKEEIKGVFGFRIYNHKLLGLGYYKDKLENVRLYEIYN